MSIFQLVKVVHCSDYNPRNASLSYPLILHQESLNFSIIFCILGARPQCTKPHRFKEPGCSTTIKIAVLFCCGAVDTVFILAKLLEGLWEFAYPANTRWGVMVIYYLERGQSRAGFCIRGRQLRWFDHLGRMLPRSLSLNAFQAHPTG